MKILNKIIESSKDDDEYVISSIERFSKSDLLLVFTDGSSVQINKNKDLYVITAVNQYNDDRNMSENFVEDVEGYKNEKLRSEELEDIIKEFKDKDKK